MALSVTLRNRLKRYIREFERCLNSLRASYALLDRSFFPLKVYTTTADLGKVYAELPPQTSRSLGRSGSRTAGPTALAFARSALWALKAPEIISLSYYLNILS